MSYRLLADAVVLAHLLFIVFVVLGGSLVLLWPRLAVLHLPAACWGAFIEISAGMCPLTPLENAWRQAAGEAGYAAVSSSTTCCRSSIRRLDPRHSVRSGGGGDRRQPRYLRLAAVSLATIASCRRGSWRAEDHSAIEKNRHSWITRHDGLVWQAGPKAESRLKAVFNRVGYCPGQRIEAEPGIHTLCSAWPHRAPSFSSTSISSW
jgi:hypothetical protein